jgi:cytochrome c oxidase cbb3-type subunit 4
VDIDSWRSIITVLSFVLFIGIVWWAYSDRRKATYDAAALSVLDDDGFSSVGMLAAPSTTTLRDNRE